MRSLLRIFEGGLNQSSIFQIGGGAMAKAVLITESAEGAEFMFLDPMN